ncbi:MAG TPA: hypothetical protein VEU33_48245, partial [Archangium sp.]|nr:hypothetical protein [Archangium sp.]
SSMSSENFAVTALELDEPTLKRLVKEPELALRRLEREPRHATRLIAGLLKDNLDALSEEEVERLLHAAALETVPAELRARIASTLLQQEEAPDVESFLEALARDAADSPAGMTLLLQYTERSDVPTRLALKWLASPHQEVRELSAVSLIRSRKSWLLALNVLLEDGRRERIAELAQEYEEKFGQSLEQKHWLREALAYVQLGRCLRMVSRGALADVLKAGSPLGWQLCDTWQDDFFAPQEGLPGALPQELPPIDERLELTLLELRLLLDVGMEKEALQLLEYGNGGYKQSLMTGLLADIPAEDKMRQRRLAKLLGQLSRGELERIRRALPVPLATVWARSPKTPREVRRMAATVALGDPQFDSKDCTLSDDAWLVAQLFEDLPYHLRDSMKAAQVLLRAAVNLLVHRPPSQQELEEQSAPYVQVREHVRGWVRTPRHSELEVPSLLRADLTDRVWNALRGVHHDGRSLVPSRQVVEAWLECAAVLRDRRLLDAVEKLEATLRDEERAALSETLRRVKEELVLRPNEDDVEVVILALKELRVA